MLDTRSPVPDWVQREFTDAGLQLRSGPWKGNPAVVGMTAGARGEIFVTYSVWKKQQPTAGTFTLGAPYPSGDPRYRAMYGIAVKAGE